MIYPNKTAKVVITEMLLEERKSRISIEGSCTTIDLPRDQDLTVSSSA